MALVNSYLLVDELVSHLRAGEAGQDNPAFELACNAGSRAVDDYCDRRFWLDASPSAYVFAPKAPGLLYITPDIGSTSGLVIETDEGDDGTFETTWAATDYQLEPLDAITKGRGVEVIRAVGTKWFPMPLSGRASVRITARWGWPSVPQPVKEAATLMAARLLKRADAPLGTYTFSDGVAFISNEDRDVRHLLRGYRRY